MSSLCLCRQAHVNHKITLARASNMGVTKAIFSYGNSEYKFCKPLNQTLSVGSFLVFISLWGWMNLIMRNQRSKEASWLSQKNKTRQKKLSDCFQMHFTLLDGIAKWQERHSLFYYLSKKSITDGWMGNAHSMEKHLLL